MLGAIIGDIVGSRWEFNPTNNYGFKWLPAANSFTDDTICTVAVADALLLDLHQGHRVLGDHDIDYILSRSTVVSGYDIEIGKSKVLNKFDETCQGTVPVAL